MRIDRRYGAALPYFAHLTGGRFPIGTGQEAVVGICSASSPALMHLEFASRKYYTRTGGQIGVTSNPFGDLMTFTGPAGRTMINALGELVTVGLNEPRIGNYIDTGSGPFNAGQLFESEERTNLVSDSRLMTDAGVFGGGTSEVITNQVAPDGSTEVRRLIENTATTNLHYISMLGTEPLTTGVAYNISVFIKPNPGNASNRYFCFRGFGVGGSNQFPVWDLNTLEIVRDATNAWSNAATDYIGGGWYRLSATVVPFNTTNPIFHLSDVPDPPAEPPAYTGDGVSGCMLWGYQLEQNVYPTSYIEAEGAPTTLAGETMQVDAPVLARAIGSPGAELVTNSDGSSGTTGWTTRANNTASVNNGRLRSTVVNSADTPAIIWELAGLTVGQRYVVSATAHRGASTGTMFFRISDTDILGGPPFSQTVVDGEEVDLVFTATGTTLYLGLVAISSPVGEYVEIEAPTFRQVTMPATVSTAMQGHMTYADDDLNPDVVFFSWALDADNRIRNTLNTVAARTGRFVTQQILAGISSSTPGDSANDYMPGTNVPFSIASRHGASFINGAHEGFLLTENTTPTALPDLIGSAFQIATMFNGNIASLTITAEDLTDAGIQAATTEGSGFNPLCPYG